MAVDQVIVSASPGDAITQAALALRSALRETVASEIYAAHIDHDFGQGIRYLHEFGRRHRRSNKIIYHASIGDPNVTTFLEAATEDLVLIYHNISPASYFVSFDPRFASLLELGRHELERLAGRATLAIADSRFNADELVRLGYTRVEVIPVSVDPRELLKVRSNGQLDEHLLTQTGVNLLFVGQQLPHKRVEWLIETFHILNTFMLPDSNLHLVGVARQSRYRWALQTFLDELQLDRVSMPGTVTTPELVSYYRHADVFVTASEHEGFCLPLVEAMAFEIPIVARDYAAVRETVGGAGVVLRPGDPPSVAAEAIAELLDNDALKDSLVRRGIDRLDALDMTSARQRLADTVISLR
jgi:glycosyltransferase involved in cell wall biosynthesis